MRNNPLIRSLGSCKMVSFVKIEGKTVKGVFKERLTRFSALVKVRDKTLQIFLPNPVRKLVPKVLEWNFTPAIFLRSLLVVR